MTNIEPPTEIIEAARKIHEWADLNGQTEYEIHGICSRKRARALEQEVALLMGRLEQLQNKIRVDAAAAALQGLCASGGNKRYTPSRLAFHAVKAADALKKKEAA